MRELIEKLVSRIADEMEYGDLEFSGDYGEGNYSVNFWLEKKYQDIIIDEFVEDLRISLIKKVDEIFSNENSLISIIKVRLKPETLPNEITEIALKINQLLEKISKDKVLEVYVE